MADMNALSRRERQIMEIVYALGSATVGQVHDQLDDAPTTMAVRRLMHILEEKGFLRRSQKVRDVVYSPRISKKRAGIQALDSVLSTFFGGSLEQAVAAHLVKQKQPLSSEQKERLLRLIEQSQSDEDPS